MESLTALQHLAVSQDPTDFVLMCSGDISDGSACQPLDCHHCVLSCSPYFRDVFSRQQQEGHVINFLHLPNVTLQVMKVVLSYMYDNSLEDMTVDIMMGVLDASFHFHMEDLTRKCLQYIQDHMHPRSAVQLYTFLLSTDTSHDLTDLIQQTLRYIRHHLSDIRHFKQFNTLPINLCYDILNHDSVHEDEDVLAMVILDYIRACEPTNRNRALLLDLVRFCHLSVDTLCSLQSHETLQAPPFTGLVSEALAYHLRRIKPLEPTQHQGVDSRIVMVITDADDCDRKKILCTKANSQQDPPQCPAGRREEKTINMHDWIIEVPAFHDKGTMLAVGDGALVCVGANQLTEGKRVSVVNLITRHTDHLSPLDDPAKVAGVTYTDHHIYVISGRRYTAGEWRLSDRVERLGTTGRQSWQQLAPIPYPVEWPIVVKAPDHVYALGGWDLHQNLMHTRVYDKKSGRWSLRAPMPANCGGYYAGGTMYRGTLVVVTDVSCMTYCYTSDTWTKRQYDRVGDFIQPFVYQDQLVACVRLHGARYRQGSCSLLQYIFETNEWKPVNLDMSHCYHDHSIFSF